MLRLPPDFSLVITVSNTDSLALKLASSLTKLSYILVEHYMEIKN